MPPRKKDKQGKEILTVREQLFVEGVAQGKSLTQAALDAGYSSDYAGQIGSENYKRLEIQRAVQERVQGVTQADTDEVLQLFASHLRGDVADFQDLFLEDGRLDLQKAKALGVSRLIKKLDYEPVELELGDDDKIITRYRCKVEFHDSQSAAKTLADIMGIKQQPRANEYDEQRRREWGEGQLKRVMEALNVERAEAIEWMRQHTPTAAEWIM